MTHPRAPTLQISRNTKKNWIPGTLAFSCSEPLMSRFKVLVNAAYLRMRHHLIVQAEMSLSKQKSKNKGIELKGQADAVVTLTMGSNIMVKDSKRTCELDAIDFRPPSARFPTSSSTLMLAWERSTPEDRSDRVRLFNTLINKNPNSVNTTYHKDNAACLMPTESFNDTKSIKYTGIKNNNIGHHYRFHTSKLS